MDILVATDNKKSHKNNRSEYFDCFCEIKKSGQDVFVLDPSGLPKISLFSMGVPYSVLRKSLWPFCYIHILSNGRVGQTIKEMCLDNGWYFTSSFSRESSEISIKKPDLIYDFYRKSSKIMVRDLESRNYLISVGCTQKIIVLNEQQNGTFMKDFLNGLVAKEDFI